MPSTPIPLTFGRGLDRASGMGSTDPTSFDALTNVHLRRGRLAFRYGNERKATLTDYTAVLAIHYVPATAQEAVVALRGNAADLLLCNIEQDGSLTVDKTYTDVLAFDPSVTRAPIVEVDDSHDKLIICHHEPNFAVRAPTKFFDSLTGDDPVDFGLIEPTDDGDDGTEAAERVRFAFARSYLEYFIGFGYGDPPDNEDRPEVVRISLPGEVVTFRPLHYEIGGKRNDRFLDAVAVGDEGSAGAVLLCFKASSTWAAVGTSAADFGIVPRDERYGVVGPRMAIVVGGICYFWSLEGPRQTTGGKSTPLDFPLELKRVTPGLTVEDMRQGFVSYLPVRREIEWHFGAFAYCLRLPDPSVSPEMARSEWSYREYAMPLLGCAGTVFVDENLDVGIQRRPRPFIKTLACDLNPVLRPFIGSLACDASVAIEAEVLDIIMDPPILEIAFAGGGGPENFGPYGSDDILTSYDAGYGIAVGHPDADVIVIATPDVRDSVVTARLRWARGAQHDLNVAGTSGKFISGGAVGAAIVIPNGGWPAVTLANGLTKSAAGSWYWKSGYAVGLRYTVFSDTPLAARFVTQHRDHSTDPTVTYGPDIVTGSTAGYATPNNTTYNARRGLLVRIRIGSNAVRVRIYLRAVGAGSWGANVYDQVLAVGVQVVEAYGGSNYTRFETDPPDNDGTGASDVAFPLREWRVTSTVGAGPETDVATGVHRMYHTLITIS
jgi:hypothetical protein